MQHNSTLEQVLPNLINMCTLKKLLPFKLCTCILVVQSLWLVLLIFFIMLLCLVECLNILNQMGINKILLFTNNKPK